MGEGFNADSILKDSQIMPFISSANIACGGHAGDESTILATIKSAKEEGVYIGAHISYPDSEHFGRRSMNMEQEELKDSLLHQLALIDRICDTEGVSLHHIKPHGALYHDCNSTKALAELLCEIMLEFNAGIKLYGLPSSILADVAEQSGITYVPEGFADRNYTDNGLLVSRSEVNAIINSPKEVIEHVEAMRSGFVLTENKNKLPISVSTICVHSDTPNALSIVQSLYLQFISS